MPAEIILSQNVNRLAMVCQRLFLGFRAAIRDYAVPAVWRRPETGLAIAGVRGALGTDGDPLPAPEPNGLAVMARPQAAPHDFSIFRRNAS